MAEVTFDAGLIERARRLAVPGERHLLGITGAPGAGKSTVAAAVTAALGPERAVLVPMDGFHHAQDVLRALGSRDRMGAWDTFDAAGYVDLLLRLRACDEPVVFAPGFDRDVEEPVAAAIAVPRDIPLVVTEGNYLLAGEGSWPEVRPLLDEVWYVELDEAVRLERLIARHVRHGKSHDAATAWATGTDQRNAELIVQGRGSADLIVKLDAS